MKKIFQWSFVVTFLMLSMGCMFVPEHDALNPTVYSGNVKNIGHGRVVALNVIDGRVDKALGHRPSAMGPMASINVSNDSAQAVYQAISTGLNARGFKTVAYANHRNEPVTLVVTLRRLRYEPKISLIISAVVHSSLEASAINNGRHYKQTYRADENHTLLVPPTSGQDTAFINKVLSENINRMFFDKKLMGFLAK